MSEWVSEWVSEWMKTVLVIVRNCWLGDGGGGGANSSGLLGDLLQLSSAPLSEDTIQQFEQTSFTPSQFVTHRNTKVRSSVNRLGLCIILVNLLL